PRFVVVSAAPTGSTTHPLSDLKPATFEAAARPVVLDATTGKVLYTIPLPKGYWSSFSLVAGAPDNRTFVLAGQIAKPRQLGPPPAMVTDPPIRYFRVHLDEQGRPGDPVVLPGKANDQFGTANAIALSPDGTRLASVSDIAEGRRVTVVDLATGRQRVWTEHITTGLATDVSWAPDGRHLAVVLWEPGGHTGVRILDLTGPGTDLGAASLVPGMDERTKVVSAAYSPDGASLIAIGTRANGPGQPVEPVQLQVLQIPLAGGTPRTLAKLPVSDLGRSNLSLDGTGHYVLYSHGRNINRVDLTTGRAQSFVIPMRQGKAGDEPGVAW
ncbi:MAG: hypothetical protein JWN52_8035, partial [Actinomycetia bacterium]|nr:hypothetical protein [Actinomycetes bacterium]